MGRAKTAKYLRSFNSFADLFSEGKQFISYLNASPPPFPLSPPLPCVCLLSLILAQFCSRSHRRCHLCFHVTVLTVGAVRQSGSQAVRQSGSNCSSPHTSRHGTGFWREGKISYVITWISLTNFPISKRSKNHLQSFQYSFLLTVQTTFHKNKNNEPKLEFYFVYEELLPVDMSGIKRGNIWKAKLMSLKRTVRTRTSETCIEE
jgi:hypothetical protein